MPSRTTRTITLAGPDAGAFANAQLSSDVLALATGRWQWSGWLDPKGRVRALLHIARVADDRYVVMPRGGDASSLAADLKRFVFRSKVKIDVSGELHVSDGTAVADGDAREEDGALVLGEGDASLRIGMHEDDDAWIARPVDKGFAWLPEQALGMLLPPALSMERLGAVAFDKGCFPGQEIAARLHFLGGHKRHLRIVRSDAALQEGRSLHVDGRDVGIVLMHNTYSPSPTSLVVLDDTMSQAETLESQGIQLHVLSTFAE
jgi:folate-binding protein YgfZ